MVPKPTQTESRLAAGVVVESEDTRAVNIIIETIDCLAVAAIDHSAEKNKNSRFSWKMK